MSTDRSRKPWPKRWPTLWMPAGTGVGKSFAYLVPLIIAAVEKDVQVVVATHTISLQEHLGMDFKAVLVKGRGNYLCHCRLARAEQMGAISLR